MVDIDEVLSVRKIITADDGRGQSRYHHSENDTPLTGEGGGGDQAGTVR